MNKRVTADGKPLSTQELEAAVEQSTRRVVRGAAVGIDWAFQEEYVS